MMEQLSGRDRTARPEFEVVPNGHGQGLSVEGLSKRFGPLVAVDGLSVQVPPGQILALLGPNGPGKTTTLLCLAGLLRPDPGQIALQGKPLGPARTRAMALIQETLDDYVILTVW